MGHKIQNIRTYIMSINKTCSVSMTKERMNNFFTNLSKANYGNFDDV